MNYSVRIAPEAYLEIEEAINYYNKINTKLSSELFNILFGSIDFIKNKPYSFTIKYKNIRSLPIEKYPYAIYYFIDETIKTVIIISIFNTYREPKNWQERT